MGISMGNSTGNHTDPDDHQSHANEMAANILGYTLVGIIVLMFFFAVVTFGRSCCIGCKNVSWCWPGPARLDLTTT
jgi:hypothetical protein